MAIMKTHGHANLPSKSPALSRCALHSDGAHGGQDKGMVKNSNDFDLDLPT